MIYLDKKESTAAKKVAVEDLLLTVDSKTTAGSLMLKDYQSLFEAEVLTRLKNAGYDASTKVNVGEFGFDLLGESSYFGAVCEEGSLKNPLAEAVKSAEFTAGLSLDVNGTVRRAAAQSGLCALKPTYGTVSRYGTIPVACSGECVSVLAQNVDAVREVYAAIAGYDAKDGTSLPTDMVENGKKVLGKKGKVAYLCDLGSVNADVAAKLEAAVSALQANGIEVVSVKSEVIALANNAWNILMCAELCNNVSRYDGVKYGYRSQTYQNLDELYVNSRTEAFGELLKAAILYGSDVLSSKQYDKVYDKALRVRRVICEAFAALFADYDAVLCPTCSTMTYGADAVKENKYLCLEENVFTAPASITGLPAAVAAGVQLIGPAYADEMLLDYAQICQKEVRR